MTRLADAHCREHRPVRLDGPQAEALLAKLEPGWALQQEHLVKQFDFPQWLQVLAFAQAVGGLAETEDHHPELHLAMRHCQVRFQTHSVQGLSLLDFISAAKVDALYPPT